MRPDFSETPELKLVSSAPLLYFFTVTWNCKETRTATELHDYVEYRKSDVAHRQVIWQ